MGACQSGHELRQVRNGNDRGGGSRVVGRKLENLERGQVQILGEDCTGNG